MRASLVQQTIERARPLQRPFLLGVLVWAIVVLLPMLELRGEVPALDRPNVRWLCLLPPVATTWAFLSGNVTTLLGVGLLGLLPALVAVPELVDPPAAAGLRGIAAAAAIALFVAACLDRAGRFAPIRRLWRWPRELGAQLLRGLGLVWLVLAWGTEAQSRPARLAAVAVVWVAVVAVPVGAGHARFAKHGWRWLFARLLWALAVVLLWRYGREVP